MSKPLATMSFEAMLGAVRLRLKRIERVVSSRFSNAGQVVATLGVDTAIPNAWVDLLTVTIKPSVPMTVTLVAACSVQSTAAGQPSVRIGLFEGSAAAGSGTLLAIGGVLDLQGSTVATQPIENVPLGLTVALSNVRGSHTYTLAAFKSPSGAASARGPVGSGGYTGPGTTLQAIIA